MLLLGENNPCVRPALGEECRMQAAVVSDIETVERPFLRSRPQQVFFVLTLAHSSSPGANDPNPTQTQRLDEITVLCVFIKIQCDFHR
jgi:hypothetical protein